MEKNYFEDYTMGERLTTPARTLTESDIVNFAGLTGDWHPLHTDREYAAKSEFGERIAHGMLTLSIGTALLYRLGPHVSLPKSFIAFYGMDQVRFIHPCRIGDTLHCVWEVLDLIEKDDERGILVAKNRIVNQKGEDLVVYITRALVGRNPDA